MNKKVQVDPLAKSRSEYEGDKFERYNYFFTLSKLAKTKTMEVFGLTQDKEDRVIVSGYPRNDALLTPPVRMNTLMNLVAERQRAGLKVGIYLPTHRSEGRGGQTERVMEELKKINPILADQQIYLLVKMHHFHGKTALKGEFSHVHIITEAEIEWDLYPALAQTDFLVTDYSSVYVDYLLIDKPVFFLTYDLADYLKNDRGFYFDYNKVTPGPKIAQWSELVPTISKELRRDEYGQERERVRQMFHKYQDGKSTERVAETLMRTLRVD